MIYEVIKTDLPEIEGGEEKVHRFEIDDTVFFANQPKDFRKKFNELNQSGQAEFDNATAALLETGRILITIKG